MPQHSVFPPMAFLRPVWIIFSFIMGILITSLFWDFWTLNNYLTQSARPEPEFEYMGFPLYRRESPLRVAPERKEFVVTLDPLSAFERWVLWSEEDQKRGADTPGI